LRGEGAWERTIIEGDVRGDGNKEKGERADEGREAEGKVELEYLESEDEGKLDIGGRAPRGLREYS